MMDTNFKRHLPLVAVAPNLFNGPIKMIDLTSNTI